MEVFTARLKWLRERSGLSQKQMAESLEISQPYYFKFEKGTGQPNLELLAKLPKILDTTLDFLLGITDYTYELEMTRQKIFELRVKMNQINNKITDGMTYINDIKSQLSSITNLENSADSSTERHRNVERTEEVMNTLFNELEEHKKSYEFFKDFLIDKMESVPMISENTKQYLNNLATILPDKNK